MEFVLSKTKTGSRLTVDVPFTEKDIWRIHLDGTFGVPTFEHIDYVNKEYPGWILVGIKWPSGGYWDLVNPGQAVYFGDDSNSIPPSW